MVLKDWKNTIKKKDFLLFRNMTNRLACSVLDLPDKKWVFIEYGGKVRVTKTKSQALSYAKEYMRTH